MCLASCAGNPSHSNSDIVCAVINLGDNYSRISESLRESGENGKIARRSNALRVYLKQISAKPDAGFNEGVNSI